MLSCFVVLVIILEFHQVLSENKLHLAIDEESAKGTVVGNLTGFVSDNFYKVNNYKVSIINDFFEINDKKDLLVKKPIDLDNFCSQSSICCNSLPCFVILRAFITTETGARHSFEINVEIRDINDNIPFFNSPIQNVTINENTRLGTKILLNGGNDFDMSEKFQIQFYRFFESTETFQLDSSVMNSLSLILNKNIDYERRNLYKAELAACDKATRCTKQNINIIVKDKDDNDPIFTKRKYEVSIKENFPLKKICLKVEAVDLDGPEFNKTRYDFYGRIDRVLMQTFNINKNTGEIKLLRKLSAKARQKYKFQVSAVDYKGDSMSKKDVTDVEITVLDINDNKPVIKSLELSKTDGYFKILINENQPPKKLISLLVSDDDLNDNGKVDCFLNSDIQGKNALELKNTENSVYDVYSRRSFDYEKEVRFIAVFQCTDRGSPQLSSHVKIEVNVIDENEFKPFFDRFEYSAELYENTQPGKMVLQVKAEDKDRGKVLKYHLSSEADKFFVIDETTGVIETGQFSFDRERVESTEFQVIVYDSLVQPHSASVQVKIRILDLNDNRPQFNPESLIFTIAENLPVNSKMNGVLRAFDYDKDPENSEVRFELKEIYDCYKTRLNKALFRVLSSTGQIEILNSLDREEVENYTLTVVVKDRGVPSLSSEANATVIVLDKNDNSPKWRYPRPRNIDNTLHDLNVSYSLPVNSLIMSLQALDEDKDEAGTVNYYLGGDQSLFNLNLTSGELTTAQEPLPLGSWELTLIASDLGEPRRRSSIRIRINIVDRSGPLSGLNLIIVVGMIVITLVIAIFLIIGIVCVRRRPNMIPGSNGNGLNTAGEYYPQSDAMKEYSLSGGGLGSQFDGGSCHLYQHPSYPSSVHGLICDGEQYDPQALVQTNANGESYIFLPSYMHEQNTINSLRHTPSNQQQFIISTGASSPTHKSSLPSEERMNTVRSPSAASSNIVTHHQNTLQSYPMMMLGNNTSSHINGTTNGMSGLGTTMLEYDGESADSGKGASEVDLRLQMGRNYSTLPAVTTFGHQYTALPSTLNCSNSPAVSSFMILPENDIISTYHPLHPHNNSNSSTYHPFSESSHHPCTQTMMSPSQSLLRHNSSSHGAVVKTHHTLEHPYLGDISNNNSSSDVKS